MAQLIKQGSTPLFDLFSIWPSGDDPASAASPSLSFDSSPWVTRVDCIAIIARITFHNCFGEVTLGEIIFWKRRRWRMQNRRNMASPENTSMPKFHISYILQPCLLQICRCKDGGNFREVSVQVLREAIQQCHMRAASHSSLNLIAHQMQIGNTRTVIWKL